MPHALKATDSPAAAVLDEAVLEALDRFRGHARPDLVDRVIRIFLKTARALVTDLTIGIETGKIAMLHHASHSLKACSAIVGATSLAALCGELEATARTGAVPDATARVSAILNEYQRVQQALIAHSRLKKA
jgi:HPt (histidine-containing phosphotransfer) domain-containing protein